MAEKLTDDQIRVAVDWWAKSIRDPEYNNGDDSFTGAMTKSLAQMISDVHPVTEEAIEKFKVALTHLLKTTSLRFLSTDYGPGRDLALCADVAEVDYSRFPWKTCMWLDEGKVIVSAGYQAPIETLWPVERST